MNIWNFDVNNSFSILRDNVGVELFVFNYSELLCLFYVCFEDLCNKPNAK